VHKVKPGECLIADEKGNLTINPQYKESEGMAIKSDIVLTPGGFRPRSLVHKVESGLGLRGGDGHVDLIDLTTERVIKTPLVSRTPQEIPALGSGWIVYTYWNNGTGRPISVFKTTWTVPAVPKTEGGQTIFLFNGIQNYGNNYGILQPVLQWGRSAAGGGQTWAVASWYVTSGGQAFHTSLTPVNVGDTLVGIMTLTGQSAKNFNYKCEFAGLGGTLLPIQNIAELLWCNETLEAYSVNQCSDYPANPQTAFKAISLQLGNTAAPLKWTEVNRITDCGQRAVIVNNSAAAGEVDLYYR